MLFTGGYALSVLFTRNFYSSLSVPSPFWLPDSVLLCALLLTPKTLWWPVLLAVLSVRLTIGTSPATPFWFLLVSIPNDLLKAMGAAWLLQPRLTRPVPLSTFREFLLFLGIAAIGFPLLSALAAAPARHALGDPFWTAMYRWFLGDALAQVVVTPMLLYWCTNAYATIKTHLKELLFFFVSLIGVLTYALASSRGWSAPLLPFVAIPFLIWSAVRLRPFGTANAVFVVAIVAIVGASNGSGMFATESASQSVLLIQLFLLPVGVSLLSLAILIAERENRLEELETLLDAAPIPILIATDPACERIVANRAGYRLHGLTTDDAAVRDRIDIRRSGPTATKGSFRILRDGADVPRDDLPLQRAAATGSPVFGDLTTLVFDDGTERHMLGNAAPLLGEDGKPRGAVGAFLDITERKLAEGALRESEALFHLVADAAPVLIWIAGADMHLSFVNRGWMDFTGRSIGRLLGDGWRSSVHPDGLDSCLSAYREAFESRRDFRMECRLQRYDGEYRWIAGVGVPRFAADGVLAGYVGSCTDVTDRKNAEKSLRDWSIHLIDVQEAERRRIARELHDDFSQRMALLQIGIERFGKETNGLSAAERKQLAALAHAAAGVSSDLHGLSRQLHPSVLEIAGLESALGSLCSEFSEQHGLDVQFVCADMPRHVARDVSLCIFRVAQEALRNVVKHSEVATAMVALSVHQERIVLSVSDPGVGFDPKGLGGTAGLGFVSMRERLRPIGGRLLIESAPFRGTMIRVDVPAGAVSEVRLPTP